MQVEETGNWINAEELIAIPNEELGKDKDVIIKTIFDKHKNNSYWLFKKDSPDTDSGKIYSGKFYSDLYKTNESGNFEISDISKNIEGIENICNLDENIKREDLHIPIKVALKI